MSTWNAHELVATEAPIAAPVLLGSLFNWGLFGVLSVQVCLYHIAFPNDRWVAKALVYGIYVLDTAQTFIVTSDVFNAYARRYGDITQLTTIQNEWLAVPVFSSIVSCIVQLYYAYRIGFLSRSRYLMCVISLLAVLQGVAGVITGIQSFLIGSFKDLEPQAHSVTVVWLTGSALCDVLIAVTMAFLLRQKDTKFPQTRAVITKLVHLIVETGVFTAFAATLLLILYLAVPNRAYYSCIGAVLAKLYSNSLLVLFNSRMRISEWDVRTRILSPEVIQYTRGYIVPPRIIRLPPPEPSGIHVQEQVFVHKDELPLPTKAYSVDSSSLDVPEDVSSEDVAEQHIINIA